MSITQIKKRCAYFYDDKGVNIGMQYFSNTDKTIKFGNSRFNVDLEATHSEFSRWYWDVHIYHYNINNPNPIYFKKKGMVTPKLSPELYNDQLETKVMKDLNDLTKDNLFGKIQLWHILVGLAIIGGLVWLISSGTLTHK